jgi:maltose O-acetyltransferase
MIAGEYYLAGDPVLVKDRRRSKNLLHRLNITEYRITKKSKRNNKRTDSECRSKSLY